MKAAGCETFEINKYIDIQKHTNLKDNTYYSLIIISIYNKCLIYNLFIYYSF